MHKNCQSVWCIGKNRNEETEEGDKNKANGKENGEYKTALYVADKIGEKREKVNLLRNRPDVYS